MESSHFSARPENWQDLILSKETEPLELFLKNLGIKIEEAVFTLQDMKYINYDFIEKNVFKDDNHIFCDPHHALVHIVINEEINSAIFFSQDIELNVPNKKISITARADTFIGVLHNPLIYSVTLEGPNCSIDFILKEIEVEKTEVEKIKIEKTNAEKIYVWSAFETGLFLCPLQSQLYIIINKNCSPPVQSEGFSVKFVEKVITMKLIPALARNPCIGNLLEGVNISKYNDENKKYKKYNKWSNFNGYFLLFDGTEWFNTQF